MILWRSLGTGSPNHTEQPTNSIMKEKQEKLYNLQELRTIAAGDNSFLNEMIDLFISQNESALLEIKNQVAAGSSGAIKTILHKMKPSVMVMGVGAATEIIRQIEQLDVSEIGKPAFADLFRQLEDTLRQVNDQLRAL